MARILLIDDSSENRAALEALLSTDGHALETVTAGRLAVSRARAVDPDLMLIDLLLPGIPSWHLIRELHRDPVLSGVPIVGLSSEAMGGARRRALAAGCSDFLSVPITPAAARAIIAHHLRNREESDITQTRPLAIGTPSIRSRARARLLIASGNPEFLHLYAVTLRYRRYLVESVASTSELLERIETVRPHLIVLDTELSDGSGIDASRRIKGRPRDPFLPVLLVVEPSSIEAAIAGSGADDFLVRPFPETEIRHRIRSLLFLASAVEGERERSRQLATVARQMSIGLILSDAEGRIILMNRPSAQILDVEPHELRGRSVRHLFRRARLRDETGVELAADFDPFQHFHAAGQASSREIYALPAAEGKPSLRIEATWTAVVDGARKFRGASLAIRRLAEDADAQRELSEAYDRLMEVDQLKSKFLSTVSHELRTPLNTIILLSHVLTTEPREGRTAEQRDHDLQVIRQSANALLHMISNLLDLARIEGGQAEISPEPVVVRGFLEETIEIVAPQAEQKNLPLRLTIAPEVPERVSLDGQKARQVLLNLLSNAIKFTERGEVSLEVEPSTTRAALAFTVRDSGMGIPADKLSMIFEPFRQVAPGDAVSGGSGLGLSIVKELVHLMGGEIVVTSRPGEGSMFRTTLPYAEAPEESRDASRPILRPLHRPKILIVEDDQHSRHGLRVVLEMEGYSTDEARTAGEALKAISGGKYDAVLMDISLPDADGTTLIRRVRAEPSVAATPIVVLTGKTSDSDRRLIEESGASAYLSKPVDVKRMLRTLGQLLDSAERQADPTPVS
jgi:signal transduction histidine kinase/chemotaxis response regulator CheB